MRLKTFLASVALIAPLFAQTSGAPFVGRWDFNMPKGGATWPGITDKGGKLDVWYQPTGGNVYQLKDAEVNGSRLTLTISPGQGSRRDEVQLENEPEGSEPPERAMGSIYGRLGPKVKMPRKPGEWETFDVTLVGRTVTVVRNGTTTIDRQEIEGITGGALDANEGEPGPFYIQGDHTGGLKFRNVTVSVPKR